MATTTAAVGMGDHKRLDPEIAGHYASMSEQRRLGPLNLERVRTWKLLTRHLPPHPQSCWTSVAPPVSAPCP